MSKEIKYREAVEKLDELIAQIEQEDIDVDELSTRVKEAVALIRTCKAKIDKAELEVKKVVDELSKEQKNEA